jgi:hypothetical protein
MRQPPLLQSLFAVMFLAIVNLQVHGAPAVELPGKDFMAFAAAAVGFGALLQPLVQQQKREDDDAAASEARDDLDLSA